MFTWGTHKIAMTPVLHFDKSPREKKTSLLVMAYNEKELDEVVKEVLDILGDIKDLNAGELPKDLPLMRDKCQMDNVVDKRRS